MMHDMLPSHVVEMDTDCAEEKSLEKPIDTPRSGTAPPQAPNVLICSSRRARIDNVSPGWTFIKPEGEAHETYIFAFWLIAQ